MIKIGIICPSEIAFRRFMPALSQLKNEVFFVGLAVCSPQERFGDELPSRDVLNKIILEELQKAQKIVDEYGGKIFGSYQEIIESAEIDAIYIPLPPALHYFWAKKALENGKHVLVEKPSTISYEESSNLVHIAKVKRLALHENYMFVFHKQLEYIKNYINEGNIGNIRLYRVSFGFPKRSTGDFRYVKTLGGGSLIDAGGYTIKYASILLGPTTKILYSKLNYVDEYDVDLFGSGALSNDNGDVVQVAFGMDNEYKCELEVWGSDGFLSTGRILTAPAGFIPKMSVTKGSVEEMIELPSDDTFLKSIKHFIKCIKNDSTREQTYEEILFQSKLLSEFMEKTK